MHARTHEVIYLRSTGETHTHTHTQTLEIQRCCKRARKARSFSIKVARHEVLSILSEPFLWTILDGILSCMTETCGQCWEKSGMSQAKAMVAPGKNEAAMRAATSGDDLQS